jgi:transposase
MMGKKRHEPPLFIVGVDLEKRVRPNDPLRRIRSAVDFSFVRAEVAHLYGYNGNESVDPEVILKLMFLLFFEDVPSERELMDRLAVRMDWLWFLGYGLEDKVPDHSVLSKARARWGPSAFESFFVRAVERCVAAGLVDGRKVHFDGSLVDANAANESVYRGSPALVAALRRLCEKEVGKLDEPEACAPVGGPPSPAGEAAPEAGEGSEPSAPAAGDCADSRTRISTTDPDAALVRKRRNAPHLRYKNHRAVDDARGVITATLTTPGDIDESHELMPLVAQHERNTAVRVETAVADTQYGTVENFRSCHERGIVSHMADLGLVRARDPRRRSFFAESDFTYDPASDTYRCPAGAVLRRVRYKRERRVYGYGTDAKVCAACALRSQCTESRSGRTLERFEDHEAIEAARAQAHSRAARRDRWRRQHLMERSFADAANNHGFKRSRWRGLWRQQIQDYLIAAVQDIRLFLRYGPRRIQGGASGPVGRSAGVFWPLEDRWALVPGPF